MLVVKLAVQATKVPKVVAKRVALEMRLLHSLPSNLLAKRK